MHHLDGWVKRDQLDVTCFIISLRNAQHVSGVNTSILRSLRLMCWVITWVALIWFDVCWSYVVVWLWWCGIRMQAEAVVLCILLHLQTIPSCSISFRIGSAFHKTNSTQSAVIKRTCRHVHVHVNYIAWWWSFRHTQFSSLPQMVLYNKTLNYKLFVVANMSSPRFRLFSNMLSSSADETGRKPVKITGTRRAAGGPAGSDYVAYVFVSLLVSLFVDRTN